MVDIFARWPAFRYFDMKLSLLSPSYTSDRKVAAAVRLARCSPPNQSIDLPAPRVSIPSCRNVILQCASEAPDAQPNLQIANSQYYLTILVVDHTDSIDYSFLYLACISLWPLG